MNEIVYWAIASSTVRRIYLVDKSRELRSPMSPPPSSTENQAETQSKLCTISQTNEAALFFLVTGNNRILDITDRIIYIKDARLSCQSELVKASDGTRRKANSVP